MSTLKTTRIIAVAIVTAITAAATSTAWAAPQQQSRGFKTYLPGEGGCKDDSGQGWVTYGCGD
jgi:hypothetical protein